MSEIFDESLSVGRPFGGLIRDHREGWTEGVVPTRHGFVSVYAQGDATYEHSTRLDFIWQGRWHIRNISGKRLSSRGLVTAAARFAEEIANA